MRGVWALVLGTYGACGSTGEGPRDGAAPGGAPALAASFSAPRPVRVNGWDGDVMEPFMSRDEATLLFNDSNAGPNPELHWATRIDDETFQHEGLVATANSTALDGVPSLTDAGRLFFVSTRSYDTTASTLYEGAWSDGVVTAIALVPGVSRAEPGIVEFDAEVSRDGAELYYVVSRFVNGAPSDADIHVADHAADGYSPRETDVLAAVSTSALEYAPATTADGLALYFTRFDDGTASIWVAARADRSASFSAPARLVQLTGFVEGPTIAADGSALWFHHRDADGTFRLYRSDRAP